MSPQSETASSSVAQLSATGVIVRTFILLLLVIYAPAILSWFRIVYHTFRRDMGGLIVFIRVKLLMSKLKRTDGTVAKCFRETALKYPNKDAIIWENGSWTFTQLDEYSNQVANFLEAQGFTKGDEISLLMEGRPEFIGIWLGAAKVGVVTAFLNTNLKQNSLVHSITTVDSKALIFTPALAQSVKEILPNLHTKAPKMKFYFYTNKGSSLSQFHPLTDNPNGSANENVNTLNNNNNNNNNNNHNNNNNNTSSSSNNNSESNSESNGISNISLVEMSEEILSQHSNQFPVHKMKAGFADKLFYVYTSGTTGLPKAAIIRNARFIFLGTGANYLIGLKPEDILYTAIPLYHMAGGALGTCQMLIYGCTLAIREKFSVSNFWTDCMKYKCTAAQYIGEICRYLLLQQVNEKIDKNHGVRVMFGNGLRPNIWREFKDRFNIQKLVEFYGATEGNANVVNYRGKEGACGFISRILPRSIVNMIYPVSIIRVDEITGQPIRSSNGLCIPCGPGETGEFVGKINKEDPTRTFDGYVNKEATEKKIYRNVFKHGDMVFSSGDLLTVDDLGYVYFKDRTGDTFRWKGENVSTTEVETVVMNSVKLSDVVVFGVEVPGCEGKAGMVAIADPEKKVDVSTLYTQMSTSLPSYALPLFIRLVDKFETTGTFKLPKVTLQKESYNPVVVTDPLYYLDMKGGSYRKLDKRLYEDVLNGQIRF